MCSLQPVVALALAALCVFPGGAAATTYTVGDSAGWDISADLDKWPLNKTFAIGDVLLSSYYSVAEVNMEGFYNCSTANAIQTGNGGSTEITITTTGHKYFICPLPLLCFGE
ncbi:unnamed protein product [Spirodela intermedia]|uniref:Phytocyanin domain-containing protein n=1 Tax=Spirodela intermedia TaxID=51605 RepID=A0A7I8JJ36_SPIIN|nr:unnamed protein product [Spirodela intermedia]CAA6669795.1 unnamed protein product [Spirodela intermedia]